MEEKDDHELVKAALAGVLGAYDGLYRRYYLKVRMATYQVLRDFHAAEDIAVDAFLRAKEKLSQFKGTSFLGWIRIIAVRQAFGELRKRHKRGKEIPLETWEWAEDDGPAGEIPFGGLNPLQELLKKERIELVRAAIDQLPPARQQCIRLCDIAEMPGPEVAEALEITHANVRLTLFRARQQLKAILQRML